MRKSKLMLTGLLLAACVLLGSSAGGSQPTRAAEQWPSYWPKLRLAANNNAVWQTEGAAPASWKTHLDVQLLSDATVANGLVYVGIEEQEMVAFDAANGEVRWRTKVNNRIRGSAVVADGKLFVGTGNRDFKRDYIDEDAERQVLVRGRGDNAVYGMDALSGRILWRFDTVGENMPTSLYKDGVLYFANGNRYFYALDANTGQLLWKLGMASYFSVSSLTTDGGDLVFAGGADPNFFYAINIRERQLQWASDTSGVEVGGIDDCSAAYADGKLFTNSVTSINEDGSFGGHGHYAINAASGEFLWRFDEGENRMTENNKCGVPVALDGVVYAGSPVNNAMYALEANTGRVIWKINTASIKNPPVVYNGTIYFVDQTGMLYVANARTGEMITKRNLGGRLNTQGPVLVNGSLYIGTQKGDMYAIPISELR